MTEAKAKTIYELFAEAKRRIGPVGKDGYNKTQHFNFRGVDAVVNAVAKAFDDLGIIPVPRLQKLTYGTAEIGEKHTRMGHVVVEVEYQFTGPLGDHIPALVPGEAMDVGDKATSKAMSVAYRTALLQSLNLPTTEADPDSQNYDRSAAGEDDEVPPPPEPNGQPKVVTDDKWLAGIKAEIDALEGEDYGRVLFRRVHEKVEAQGCTAADGKALQADITEKVAALGKAAKDASPGDGPPSPDGRHREEVPA